MTGKLIGVGLGPGDPELMTLKAARLIASAPVIAYPALPGTESFARRIAAAHIAPGTREIVMDVPMTRERAPAQAAYDLGAARIAEALESGHDVVVLCEGDPFLYGSFMYLHARLRGRFPVEVVPGVTSLTAAAARAERPLAARNESFAVLPATLDDASLRRRLGEADSAAILKVGRQLARLRVLLGEMGLLEQAVYVEHASLPGEVVLPLAEAPDPAPYFSIILVTKGADPWLKPRS
ncbi:MAG: precorrin-2 C(20)-methyltransferase [Alphaproteobacteria bacterium]|nr:MAG: precorrin-2 C(20)-methyltransferase [Alphaproteobacteria bacterium]